MTAADPVATATPRRRRGRTIAYHLAREAAWTASPPEAAFRPATLTSEGFVHLTHRMADLVEVANAFYRDEPGPHVVLTIALGRLDAPWRYDGDRRFPHVYGPLDRRAIVDVRAMGRDASGDFVAVGRSRTAPPHARRDTSRRIR